MAGLMIVLLLFTALCAMPFYRGFIPFGLFLRAYKMGFPFYLLRLAEIRLKGLRPDDLLNAYIMCRENRIDTDADDIIAHQFCGGDVIKVSSGLVRARRNGIDVNYKDLSVLDLTGRDIGAAIDRNKTKKNRADFLSRAFNPML
jgi:uncharacterized protein YqfA (UPF0365 family)